VPAAWAVAGRLAQEPELEESALLRVPVEPRVEEEAEHWQLGGGRRSQPEK
jgi:hypothetical protein